MKKLRILIITLMTIFAFNVNVFAASGTLSVSSNNVYVGNSFSVTVRINSAAAWNVHVTASGPVEGCKINEADATSDAMDTNKTFTANCKATGEGIININLTGDVTSASDGNAVNLSGSKTVNVTQKPTIPSSNNNNNNNTVVDNRSKNNNIKELTIEGFELVKVNDNNYTLSVSNDIANINIKAIAEDSKAKISGDGLKELKIGENTFEVIVTSESGLKNTIVIKVIRKDGYYLDDLDEVLKNTELKDIDIIINADSVISKEDISKIKDSKKNIRLNYYDENKKLIYSWTINGSKINNTIELTTNISYTSDNMKEIYKLSNYADGLYINFKHDGILPAGTKIKLYVGDKFEDDSIVNVYKYNNTNKSLKFIKDSLKVTTGYIEFELEHCSEYFVTMSNIGTSIQEKEANSNILWILIAILEFVIIVILILMYYIKFKNKKNY